MGDEILPDEVMEIRVQMTKRYQEQPDKRPLSKARWAFALVQQIFRRA